MDIGRAISRHTKLLQRIERSTTFALDPARRIHLMLANALCDDRHLIIDTRSGCRILFTVGGYLWFRDRVISAKFLSFECAFCWGPNDKRNRTSGELWIPAIGGASMPDTLRSWFMSRKRAQPPRFQVVNHENTLETGPLSFNFASHLFFGIHMMDASKLFNFLGFTRYLRKSDEVSQASSLALHSNDTDRTSVFVNNALEQALNTDRITTYTHLI